MKKSCFQSKRIIYLILDLEKYRLMRKELTQKMKMIPKMMVNFNLINILASDFEDYSDN